MFRECRRESLSMPRLFLLVVRGGPQLLVRTPPFVALTITVTLLVGKIMNVIAKLLG
jgi:hypothetical protein